MMQHFRDICKDYGLSESEEIERLAECGLNAYATFHHFQLRHGEAEGILDVEDFQFRKDLATLASIFLEGRNITIDATMPDGECKEKHTTIHIEKDSFLQYKASCAFLDLLCHYCIEEYECLNIEGIIEYESRRIEEEKAMMGRKERTKTEIPKLGKMVQGFINAGGDGLAALTPTKKYCLIGNMILEAGASPVEREEWGSMTNKEKADKVKSWEKSFNKASRKIE